jgi:hypothetical protein
LYAGSVKKETIGPRFFGILEPKSLGKSHSLLLNEVHQYSLRFHFICTSEFFERMVSSIKSHLTI